jgi:hypothetical protein
MTTAPVFQWVILKHDILNTLARAGDRAVIVDLLPPTAKQPEAGYTLEIFRSGKIINIVSVPISWVTPTSETWGKSGLEVAPSRAEIS